MEFCDMDQIFIKSEEQIKLEMEPEEVSLAKRKRISTGDDEKIKKKDREFDEKKKLAQEVSKYPNIFDIKNKGFLDKTLQQITWNKIANAVDMPVEKCTSHWYSLKRSARYYANDQRIVYKSEGTPATYRMEWSLRDVMEFYTPPSLRDLTYAKPKATSTSLNLSTQMSATSSRSPSGSVCSGENEDLCYAYEQVQSSEPRAEKDQLGESVSLMANALSSYLQCKSVPLPVKQQETQPPPKPTLKYMEMWAHFDTLVRKLDEDAVDDLNIDIMNLIGVALKKKRKKNS